LWRERYWLKSSAEKAPLSTLIFQIFKSSNHPIADFPYLCTSFFKTMGRGRKTQREMNRLIKAIKRKRILKKAAHRSFARPVTESTADTASAPAETAAVETPVAETAAE
jgi:hypothetical protein